MFWPLPEWNIQEKGILCLTDSKQASAEAFNWLTELCNDAQRCRSDMHKSIMLINTGGKFNQDQQFPGDEVAFLFTNTQDFVYTGTTISSSGGL